MRVEEAGELRGDLGHQLAGDRDEPVTQGAAEPESAPTHRPLISGLGAVGVEEHRPRLRLDPEFVGGAPHRRPVTGPGRFGNECLFGGGESGGVGVGPGAVEFADDRGCGIRPDLTPSQRRRHGREPSPAGLAREPVAQAGGRTETDASARFGPGHLGDPLEQLDRGPAPLAGRQPCIAELGTRPLRDLTRDRDPVRIDDPTQRLEHACID